MNDSAYPVASATLARGVAQSGLYRAVWRWHFYAGLIALPFLILLAVTGGLYLLRDQIDGFIHSDLKQVERQASAPLAPQALVAAALAAQPGTAFRYTPAPSATASTEVGIRATDGQRLVAYINPYDGRALGTLPDKGTIMWFIRQLHSLSWFGPIANGMIEIVAGWSILLVGTGLYLWWPRGQSSGVVTVRGSPRKRPFWRDLHGVLGLFTAGFIVFLAVTGMPWSIFWGSYANQWANGNNFGYPAGVRVSLPVSGTRLNQSGPVSWSLEQARLPESHIPGPASPEAHDHGASAPEAHHHVMPEPSALEPEPHHPGAPSANQPSTTSAPNAPPIGLDAAVAIFNRLGLAPGYAVALPAGATGVYTGSVYPDDLARQRVVHLDQYSGTPLLDMSYADYGLLGRGLEWGINVHMGQQYGLVNKLVLLAACLGIVALAISGGVMWWKRRPAGALGIPPAPADRRLMLGVAAILAIGGVIFPLVGASMLAMGALDALFGYRRAMRR
jgi:uncharacterized iron-regulated membrane protein